MLNRPQDPDVRFFKGVAFAFGITLVAALIIWVILVRLGVVG
jgi:hypothetical protein